MIEEVSSALLPANGDRVPEVILRGQNFTPECRVVFNDQFVPTRFYDAGRLGVTMESKLLKEPGTYLLAVVQPDSGGAVSNMCYFSVTY